MYRSGPGSEAAEDERIARTQNRKERPHGLFTGRSGLFFLFCVRAMRGVDIIWHRHTSEHRGYI